MNKIILNNDDRDYLIWREGMGRTVEIFDIAVGSERRKGKGSELIRIMLKYFIALPEEKRPALVYAITRISNTIAHEFYEYQGFRIVGRLHNFYRDGSGTEHGLLFGLDI